MSGLIAVIHCETWSCRLTSASNHQYHALPNLPVLFVRTWCPLFCPSRTKENLLSLSLTGQHPYITTFPSSSTHWLRFCWVGMTSSVTEMNMMRLASITHNAHPADLPLFSIMPVHPLPLFFWEAAASPPVSSSCSSTKLATICLLSGNEALPHAFKLSPNPNPALPLCPVISLCCSAPCTCWTDSTSSLCSPLEQWVLNQAGYWELQNSFPIQCYSV